MAFCEKCPSRRLKRSIDPELLCCINETLLHLTLHFFLSLSFYCLAHTFFLWFNQVSGAAFNFPSCSLTVQKKRPHYIPSMFLLSYSKSLHCTQRDVVLLLLLLHKTALSLPFLSQEHSLKVFLSRRRVWHMEPYRSTPAWYLRL